ncbi:MAG: ABC transporter permease subunit [Ardenticatenaceae bacterium]|nr:ABC transporter permease subunit [Ardenticatenaceae bacterium]
MEKVKTIIGKEWAEVFKNRLVLFTVAFLPLILVALPLVTFYFTGNLEGTESIDQAPDEFFGAMCEGMSEDDCAMVFMLNLYTLMLMILPVAIPVSIAAYSVVGEKTTRSLEPMLATPITTAELLLGKALAAVIPAVVATWVGYAIYVGGTRLLVNDLVFSYLMQPLWFIAILVVSPLLALMAVSFGLMVSSRVTDPRVAEQVSAVVILPLIMLVVGQSVGLILIDQRTIILMAVIVAVIDGVLLYFTVKLFQRETILTRWR